MLLEFGNLSIGDASGNFTGGVFAGHLDSPTELNGIAIISGSTGRIAPVGGVGMMSLNFTNNLMGFCDGSVRFAQNSINVATWRALSTASGGDLIANW